MNKNSERIRDFLLTCPKGKAGNVTIRQALQIPETDFWVARNHLIDLGLAMTGRGKGGSTILVESEPQPEMVQVQQEADLPTNEAGWYKPLRDAIEGNWAASNGFTSCIVEITSSQGRRNTGGKWTRPDISAITVRKFPFIPQRTLDVWAFEVKRFADLDVSAVYESVAHARAATRACLIVCFDGNERSESVTSVMDQVESVARRHGVGLIAATWPGTFYEWDVIVDPEPINTSPEMLNDFIGKQIPERHHGTIRRWCHER